MTTPGRPWKRLTERLRAIAGRSDASPVDVAPRTHVRTASFERARGRVWVPPDPTRRWFEDQGIEPAETPKKWWQGVKKTP